MRERERESQRYFVWDSVTRGTTAAAPVNTCHLHLKFTKKTQTHTHTHTFSNPRITQIVHNTNAKMTHAFYFGDSLCVVADCRHHVRRGAATESQRPTSITRHYRSSQQFSENSVCVCACTAKAGLLDFKSYFLDYWGHFLFVPQTVWDPKIITWLKACRIFKMRGKKKERKTKRKKKILTWWLLMTGRKERKVEDRRGSERSYESPSSDNKAFPMTPPSGQELKPGNRTRQPRRWGYADGGMAEIEKKTELMAKK